MESLPRRNRTAVKSSRGFAPDYKQRRLEQWELLSASWLEYTQEDSFHMRVHQEVSKAVSATLDRSTPRRPALVDLGCGPGYFLNFVVRNAEEWWRLVGIDFCPRALDLAKNSNPFTLPAIECYRADLELPLDGRTAYTLKDFDTATATFLLDEVEDIAACIASATSVLRAGGHFIAATLDVERERQRYGEAVRIAGHGEGPVVLSKSLHLNGRFSSGEFFRVLRPVEEVRAHAQHAGLEIVDDRVLSPSDLGSRPDGPGLRLTTWRRR